MEELGQEDNLKKLVKRLCKAEEFEDETMKKIKTICKRNDQSALQAFKSGFEYLTKNHCVVRLNSLQMITQLFARSHYFRTLVINKLEQFAESVLGTNPTKPLPLPSSHQKRLRKEGILAIKEWMHKFGDGYKTLRIAFESLSELVDFQEVCLHSDPERKRSRERRARLSEVASQRLETIRSEKNELDPVLDEFYNQTTILLNLLKEGDSSALQEEIKGNLRLIEKSYLLRVEVWIDSLSRHSSSESQDLLRISLNTKLRLSKIIKELKEHYAGNDEDYLQLKEEVDDLFKPNETEAVDPTTFEATLKKLNVDPRSLEDSSIDSQSPGKSYNSSIPTVRLSDLTVPDRMVVDPERSRFWVSDHREGQIIEMGTTSKVTEFIGETLPITRSCRAPLSNGNLCPRMDREKCPFHGIIISRDENGQHCKESNLSLVASIEKKKLKSSKSGLKAAKKYDESSRSRISSKISSKSSLKRLAKDLKRYDKIRTKDKFSDNFNY